MIDQMIVLDDFYNDPDQVRNFALSQEFKVEGNYPGLRTDPATPEHSMYLKSFFEDSVLHRKITYWNTEDHNTCFQYTVEGNTTWVHHDETHWAGVVYLTPNAPIGYGTSIYSHKETDIYQWDSIKDSESDFNHTAGLLGDLDKWEPELIVGNRYNRLVLYRGSLYHRSTIPGFGNCPETGRLFQVFFFDTEF
jgi:hypothetical protein